MKATLSSIRVLLIEDQVDLSANLYDYLSLRGFQMDAATDGVSGLHLARNQEFDVIILDVMLPRLDGLELCRRLRQEMGKSTPVLMLTARDTLEDKIAGFSAGADDYLVKPFDLPELEHRLRALHKRASGAWRKTLAVGPLHYDIATLTVTRDGRQLSLNATCRIVLEALMRAAPDVVPRSQLEHLIWDGDPPDSDSLRSHVYLLRRQIDAPFAQPMLQTVHGLGYRLVAPPTADNA